MGEFNKPGDKIALWVIYLLIFARWFRFAFFFTVGSLLYLGARQVVTWIW